MATAEERQEAEDFYCAALDTLEETGIQFLVGGAFSMREYADIVRDTKDLDVFCRPRDYAAFLQAFDSGGYKTEITDATWLAKASRGQYFVDLIFGSANLASSVDDSWFDHARSTKLLGREVKLVPPEEVLWQKAYVQQQHRFDGPDVLHVIRKQGASLDWKRLLQRMDEDWEVLLAHLLTFRWVYPSERGHVPEWVLTDLLSRAEQQMGLPIPRQRVCRGPLLSRTDYTVDITEWGYEWGYKQT